MIEERKANSFKNSPSHGEYLRFAVDNNDRVKHIINVSENPKKVSGFTESLQ